MAYQEGGAGERCGSVGGLKMAFIEVIGYVFIAVWATVSIVLLFALILLIPELVNDCWRDE